MTGVCSARNADLVRALGADHVIDYASRDFTADPIGQVRELYERVGLDFTTPFETGMKMWSAENPPHRFGRFTYSVDALGVDVAALDARLDPYRERFGVPREAQRKG